MTPPRIDSIRLSTRLTGARSPAAPPPPLGISAWSVDGNAIAVLLDATGSDLSTVESVAAQLSDAAALPPGTLVLVLGAAARALPAWRRLLGSQAVPVARALRCSALLARGYVNVGAHATDDLTWGWSSDGPSVTP